MYSFKWFSDLRNIECSDLRNIGAELFDTKKIPRTPLTPEHKNQHSKSDKCFICQKKFSYDKKSKYYKNFRKVKDHDNYTGIYRDAAHSKCNLRHSTQNDIPIVTQNGSKYDFHLIIKELAKEFRSEIRCIPEDKEKYKTFSIPIMYKEVNDKVTPYNLRFIDSNSFMLGSLENHVNDLSELHDCNWKDKSKPQLKIKYDKVNIHTRCKTCTKRSKQSIQSLKNNFPSTFCLVNGNIDKFILLLKKGVYPYEYMNDWKKFEEPELPSHNEIYSNLYLKNISKEDFKHAQNVWKTFNIKNSEEYHDLYVQSDTTQLADIFEQFRTLCLKEYELDPADFCTTPGLAMEACLKKTEVKLELLTDINMALRFEKGIRGDLKQYKDMQLLTINTWQIFIQNK